MTARQDTLDLIRRVSVRTAPAGQTHGIQLSYYDANTLRRAAQTLHTWAERECGTEYGCIFRSETDGKPYWHDSRSNRQTAIPDRERGALKRIAAVCAATELHYYHQTDPRGCALYIACDPMTDSNYSSIGIAVY